MSLAVVPIVWQLSMKFDGNENGWSEQLYLADAAPATLVASATLLCQYRLQCLSPDCKLVWARVSQVGNPRDAMAVLLSFPVAGAYAGVLAGSPPLPIAGTNTVNDDDNAVMYRIESVPPGGGWANRWMHGIPDIQVTQGVLANAITEAALPLAAIGTLPAANLWPALVGIYFRAIQSMTVFFRRRKSFGATIYWTDSINSITVRKMGDHKTGRFFGQSAGRRPLQ